MLKKSFPNRVFFLGEGSLEKGTPKIFHSYAGDSPTKMKPIYQSLKRVLKWEMDPVKRGQNRENKGVTNPGLPFLVPPLGEGLVFLGTSKTFFWIFFELKGGDGFPPELGSTGIRLYLQRNLFSEGSSTPLAKKKIPEPAKVLNWAVQKVQGGLLLKASHHPKCGWEVSPVGRHGTFKLPVPLGSFFSNRVLHPIIHKFFARETKPGFRGPYSVQFQLPEGPLSQSERRGKVLLIRGSETQPPEFMILIQDETEFFQMEKNIKSLTQQIQKNNLLGDQLLNHVIHDLKTPLSNTLGVLRLMDLKEEFKPPENLEKLFKSAISSAENLSEMIDDLLQISLFKSGRMQPQFKFFPAKKLILQIMDSLAGLGEKKGISINNLLTSRPILYGDPNLIRDAFTNILGNALKFCPRGSRIKIYEDEGPHWSLVIEDNGKGIPKKWHPHLFEPHVRTTSRGTDGERGTGLGLPYCKDLIEAHSGRISVESVNKKGEGTRFLIEFPRVQPALLILQNSDGDNSPIEEILHPLPMQMTHLTFNLKKIQTLLENSHFQGCLMFKKDFNPKSPPGRKIRKLLKQFSVKPFLIDGNREEVEESEKYGVLMVGEKYLISALKKYFFW